jgi:hypothetical protein
MQPIPFVLLPFNVKKLTDCFGVPTRYFIYSTEKIKKQGRDVSRGDVKQNTKRILWKEKTRY